MAKQKLKYLSKQSKKLSPKLKLTLGVLCLIVAAALYIYENHFADKPSVPEGGSAEVHFIDVGQGDAALIVSEDCVTVIDCGPSSAKDSLVAYLGRYCKSIDYLILSHPHEDHIGGAEAVIENFEVKHVIMPDAVSSSSAFTRLLDALEDSDCEVITATPGESFSCGNIGMKVLAPNSDYGDDLNNQSAVVRVDIGATSFLFTGDAESESESEMLGSFSRYLDCDVLKLGHHGSVTSTSERFLSAVSPKYAVVSCASGNDYGHPHRETVEKLQKAGISLYRTDRDGTVVFVTDGETVAPK